MACLTRALLFLLAVFAAMNAPAQGYPERPIRLIVPVPPGGSSDILARLIGARITEAWGQQVVVDNRPGANGNIGAEVVGNSSRDMGRLLSSEKERWAKLIKDTGFKLR